MSYFTSKRERRLWLWTLVTIVAIYSTLGIASTLAEIFYNQNIAAIAFLFSMFLIGLTILTQGLKVRPGGFEIAIALGIVAVYFMMFFRMTMPERSHLIEYSVVAAFIYEALTERVNQGRYVFLPVLTAIIMTSMVGVLDECIQLLLPGRVFDPVDMFFNSMAATMAVIASAILSWAKQRFGKR